MRVFRRLALTSENVPEFQSGIISEIHSVEGLIQTKNESFQASPLKFIGMNWKRSSTKMD